METTEKTIIQKLESHIADNCTAIDRETAFDSMLDECYSFDSVSGPFAGMSPSRVLKEVDPIAYRCGVNDYEDSEGWIEIDGGYYVKDEAERAADEFVDGIENTISNLDELFTLKKHLKSIGL